MPDESQTPRPESVFDFGAFPPDTCFHDRRGGPDRRGRIGKPEHRPTPAPERRKRHERRRHVDPTTFERQYSTEELDFMNAMQAFKARTGRSFPTYSEVLAVARDLGYILCEDSFEIDIHSHA